MNRLIELANLILLRWDDPRGHQPDCRCACWVHGYFVAAQESKLRDDAERALRNIRLSDAQMHDLVVLRDRYQRGRS